MAGTLSRIAVCVTLICGLVAARSQSAGPAQGTVLDSLRVGQRPSETYALYLPMRYDPAVPAPVVFIFDPAARGRVAVELFIPASERYGYILVCSNNTRNGPYEQNFEFANRLFTEVFARFQIDPKRVYTAGFSGGSRLASSIAILTKQIQGVVACGAGMASSPVYFQMSELDDFSFAGIVGNVDMNYREMIQTRNWLNQLKVSNELFEYDYGHRWPPPEDLLAAFDWLQLEACRKGIVPVDSALVGSVYDKFAQKARELEASGEQLRAWNEYDRLLGTFGTYFDLDSIRSRHRSLAASKPYRKARRAWEANQAAEDSLVSNYSARMYRDIAAHGPEAMAWWDREIGRLEAKQQKAGPEGQRMLQRVLNTIFAMAYSRATDEALTTTVPQKAFCLDLCIRAQPGAPMAYFMQMEHYLQAGNPDKALDYLEQLLQTGFDKIEYIEGHKALEPLKSLARYKALMPG